MYIAVLTPCISFQSLLVGIFLPTTPLLQRCLYSWKHICETQFQKSIFLWTYNLSPSKKTHAQIDLSSVQGACLTPDDNCGRAQGLIDSTVSLTVILLRLLVVFLSEVISLEKLWCDPAWSFSSMSNPKYYKLCCCVFSFVISSPNLRRHHTATDRTSTCVSILNACLLCMKSLPCGSFHAHVLSGLFMYDWRGTGSSDSMHIAFCKPLQFYVDREAICMKLPARFDMYRQHCDSVCSGFVVAHLRFFWHDVALATSAEVTDGRPAKRARRAAVDGTIISTFIVACSITNVA